MDLKKCSKRIVTAVTNNSSTVFEYSIQVLMLFMFVVMNSKLYEIKGSLGKILLLVFGFIQLGKRAKRNTDRIIDVSNI